MIVDDSAINAYWSIITYGGCSCLAQETTMITLKPPKVFQTAHCLPVRSRSFQLIIIVTVVEFSWYHTMSLVAMPIL